MRVLLTGSSGWLGRFLKPKLEETGHEVIGLDPVPSSLTDVEGSVSDRALVDNLFTTHRFEGVIHAGALHKPDIVRYSRRQFIDVNVTGTLNLLEASARTRVSSFVFTSTTSLMITQEIRDEKASEAVWLNEASGPLAPRNIYGATKQAAEEMCRLIHSDHHLAIVILRTARFFPEEDDTHRELTGENMKANEFLHRRLSVEDCADAHVAALRAARQIGYGTYVVSAPPPFNRNDCAALKEDAVKVIAGYFPDAPALFAQRGWQLPRKIGRVYDPYALERDLGFRCQTDFGAVLAALRANAVLPFTHESGYESPNSKVSLGD